jgi:hypothetical protein
MASTGAAAGTAGGPAAAADGGAAETAPQWAESVLLQAVSTAGYSTSAHAAVELEGLVESLRENVRQEREMAGDMMQVRMAGCRCCWLRRW